MPYGENSDTLRDAVNDALKELREEGKLAEISEKYFGMDITEE
jgi:cystine transport system substrate-binding protein